MAPTGIMTMDGGTATVCECEQSGGSLDLPLGRSGCRFRCRDPKSRAERRNARRRYLGGTNARTQAYRSGRWPGVDPGGLFLTAWQFVPEFRIWFVVLDWPLYVIGLGGILFILGLLANMRECRSRPAWSWVRGRFSTGRKRRAGGIAGAMRGRCWSRRWVWA